MLLDNNLQYAPLSANYRPPTVSGWAGTAWLPQLINHESDLSDYRGSFVVEEQWKKYQTFKPSEYSAS